MMDDVEASAFGGFALEAMGALKDHYGTEAVVRNAMFVVEVQKGDGSTDVFLYSTDARGYVQKAFLNEAIEAIERGRVPRES